MLNHPFLLLLSLLFALYLSLLPSSAAFATGANFEITVENSPASRPLTPQPGETPDEPLEPTSGAISWITGQTFTVGEADEAIVKIDYPLRLFDKLRINGHLLTEGIDFTLEEGSTVIEFSASFLATLTEPGTYKLAVYYTDGAVAETSFLVSATPSETSEPSDSPEATVPAASTSNITTPNTGRFYYRLTPSRVFTPPVLALIITSVLLGLVFLNRFHLTRFFSRLSRSISSATPRFLSALRTFRNARPSHKNPHSLSLSRLHFIPIFSGAFLAVFGLLFVAFSLGLVRSNHDSTATSDSLELSVSDSTLKQAADLSSGSAEFVLTQDIQVTNSTTRGYLLYLSSTSLEHNELSLDGAEDSTDIIAAVSGRPASPVVLSANSYGYTSVDNPSSSAQVWSGVPTNKTPNLLKSTYSETVANDTTTVAYGFNLSGDLSNGTYKGANNSSVVYTAIANPDPVYSISYYCNGGARSDNSVPASVTKKYGEDLTLYFGDLCVRPGYAMSSWNTKPDGSGTSYALGATFSENISVLLYAIWEKDSPIIPEKTFILKYDANGGKNAPAQESKTVAAVSYTFTISSATPTRSGYTFSYWTLASDSSDTQYTPGSPLTVTATSNTLRAVWEKDPEPEPLPDAPIIDPVEEYTVSFVCGDGSTASSEVVAYGTELTAPNASLCASSAPADSTFSAWNTKPDGSGYDYSPGKTILPSANLTLYAIYEPDRSEELTTPLVFDCMADFITIDATGNRKSFSTSFEPAKDGTCTVFAPTVAPDSITPGATFVEWQDESCEEDWCTGYSPAAKISWTIDPNNSSTYSKSFLAIFQDPVLVEEIQLSGDSTLLMNHSKTLTLTTTVLPETAANKSVTYTSSNKSIATVSSKGVVTAKAPGEVTITATAKDGSGTKGTFKLKITQKVIIVTGPSSIVRISGAKFANVQEYTDASSKNYYSIADGTLMFAALGGTGFKYQTLWASGEMGDGWRKIDQYVRSYAKQKEYVNFYIFFNIASAAASNNYTCNDFLANSSYIAEWTEDYDRSIKSLTSENYKAVGIVMSEIVLEPSNPDRGSHIVSNTDSRRCGVKYRSNYKINRVNASFYSLIEKSYPDLRFRQVFKDIVDTSDHTKDYPYKPGWEDYHTSDGIHFDNPTAIKYFNAMLNKYGSL